MRPCLTWISCKGSSDLESTNRCHTSEGWYPVTFIEKSKGTRLPTFKTVVTSFPACAGVTRTHRYTFFRNFPNKHCYRIMPRLEFVAKSSIILTSE